MIIRRAIRSIMEAMVGELATAGPVRRKIAPIAMSVIPGQMSCKEFHTFITAYADGELPANVRQSFEFHLEICAKCRTYLKTYMSTIELSRRLSIEGDENELFDAPHHLIDAITAAIRMTPRHVGKKADEDE